MSGVNVREPQVSDIELKMVLKQYLALVKKVLDICNRVRGCYG